MLRVNEWMMGCTLLLLACGDKGENHDAATETDPGSTTMTTCTVGSEGCACYPNGTCDLGYSCLSSLCVDAADGTTLMGDTMSASSTGGETLTSSTTGTSEGTQDSTSSSDASESSGEDRASTTTADEESTGAWATGRDTQGSSDSTQGSTGGTQDGSTSEGGGESTDEGGEESTGGEPLPWVLTADENGWVSRTTNRQGVQGVWFTYTSPLGATITPAEGEAWAPNLAGRMCMSGQVDEVPCDYDEYYYEYVCDYENHWGVAGAFHLCAPGEDDALPDEGEAYRIGECPWADFSEVVGFSFRISGSVPDGTRLVFDEASSDESPFIPITVSGTRIRAAFEDASNPYLVPIRPLDVEDVTSLSFQVSASASAARAFDFCIYDLQPIFE